MPSLEHHLAVASCVALAFASTAAAQERAAGIGIDAIALVTRDTHTPGDRTRTEAYLTRPVASGFLDARWFHVLGMLDLEGLTLRRGELDLGAWGEGYIDRRHPHAYVHELMAGVDLERSGAAVSLYTGRGFASFGSDDPMSRPFVSYPVDHHLAQILERVVVIGAARLGPMVAEATTFNGDEPLDPSTAPRFSRFGDSWAIRGTLVGDGLARVLHGAELAASYAAVKSPEYRDGLGLDQRKAHVALRLTGESGALARYALVEAARTTDLDQGRSLYTFDALLAEGAVCRGELGFAARWERSDRPEEERSTDLFRAPRPATDVSILGVTQWTTVTTQLALPSVHAGVVHGAPFVEVARLAVDRTSAALFDPARFYGATAMWRVDLGLRIGAGRQHARMGRYGAAQPPTMHEGGHTAHTSGNCFS
jgi:hypothetical protein